MPLPEARWHQGVRRFTTSWKPSLPRAEHEIQPRWEFSRPEMLQQRQGLSESYMPGREEDNVSQLLNGSQLVKDLPLKDLHEELSQHLLPHVPCHGPILPHLEPSTTARGGKGISSFPVTRGMRGGVCCDSMGAAQHIGSMQRHARPGAHARE